MHAQSATLARQQTVLICNITENYTHLLVPIASISSMNTIDGACSSATRNNSRTSLGPSPYTMESYKMRSPLHGLNQHFLTTSYYTLWKIIHETLDNIRVTIHNKLNDTLSNNVATYVLCAQLDTHCPCKRDVQDWAILAQYLQYMAKIYLQDKSITNLSKICKKHSNFIIDASICDIINSCKMVTANCSHLAIEEQDKIPKNLLYKIVVMWLLSGSSD